MAKRNSNLLERGPDDIDVVLGHPRQQAIVGRITELITALRTLKKPVEYYDFQAELFREVYAAQEQQAVDSRRVKRKAAGKHEEADLKDLELELAVSDRIVRQLRGVGDALAWRVFDFDRRFFMVLSQNAPVSPMVNKPGLDYELGEVVETWKREKCFSLLHDLTNTLRIGDLTKFTTEGPRLVEVKSGASGPTRKQRERMQRAINVINGDGGPLDPELDSSLWRTSIQFKTRLKKLGEAIDTADRNGFSSLQIADQWSVSCLSLASPGLPKSTDEAIEEFDQLKVRTFMRARMQHARHHLRGTGTVDRVGKSGSGAPLAIYPFSPWTCARLLCDYITFENIITWEHLAAAFEREGFGVECPLEEKHGPASDDQPVLILTRGVAGLTIPGSGIHQVLFEFLDPKALALVMKEFFVRANATGPVRFLFAFANERAVWK